MDESELLIIGANGQLGMALRKAYPKAQAIDSDDLDISSSSAVDRYSFSNYKVVFNAAAYTNVDGAESPAGRISAWQINSVGVANLARTAESNDLILVHVSSDYVFDGNSNPHREDEPFSPLGVYGQSKAAGDITCTLVHKHYIMRTSWVIGEGNNFVRTMLDLGFRGVNPTVVSDQIGRPSFTEEIVRAFDHLMTKKPEFGTYNISNGGPEVNWADLARSIFHFASMNNIEVTDITTDEYFASKPGIAPRPLNSTLDLSKLEATGFNIKDWQEDLKEYVYKEVSK